MAQRVRAAALPWPYAALALLLSGVVVLAYLGLRDAPAISAIEGQSLNWRFELRGVVPPPDSVAVIAIDDRSMSTLGHWPVPRGQLAAAIRRLREAGVAAVGVDLLLLDRPLPASGLLPILGDQALGEALGAGTGAVLALALTFAPGSEPSQADLVIAQAAGLPVVLRPAGGAEVHGLRATGLMAPVAFLRSGVTLAHVNMPLDGDGVLRDMPAAIALGDRYLPAFPIELARRFRSLAKGKIVLSVDRGVKLGTTWLALDPRLRLPINYYGPAGRVPTYSFVDLLAGRVPVSALHGRAVLLGATALGVGDTFATPFSQTMPGVEVLATITGNLLNGQVLERRALRDWDVGAILLLGLAAFLLTGRPPPLVAGAAIVGLLAAWAVVAQLAFSRGLWLDMAFPVAAILLNGICVTGLRAGLERRMRRNLSRYHSPVIVNMLAARARPRFEGRSQNAAIMFADIAGFTRRMERLAPADTVQFLRDFHGRIERAVLAHGGLLQQFMGDGAMVIFGLPEPSQSDAAAALACARDLVADIGARNAELAAAGEAPFAISVGVHYGPVVMARLGGPTQAQISAAGDTVNVASRLEKLTRAHGAVIAVSEAVVAAVRKCGRSELLDGFESIAAQTIRGRVGRLSVWIQRRVLPTTS